MIALTLVLDLLWLREESPPTPSLHTPISEAPPTPATPTPPPVEIHIDPYERRLRKAIAQLDKTKSVSYTVHVYTLLMC